MGADRCAFSLIPIDLRTEAMSTRQDEIREAIRGFADQIKPAVDPNQASPGTAAVHNEYPPLQRAENGGFVFHVGDTLFG